MLFVFSALIEFAIVNSSTRKERKLLDRSKKFDVDIVSDGDARKSRVSFSRCQVTNLPQLKDLNLCAVSQIKSQLTSSSHKFFFAQI